MIKSVSSPGREVINNIERYDDEGNDAKVVKEVEVCHDEIGKVRVKEVFDLMSN